MTQQKEGEHPEKSRSKTQVGAADTFSLTKEVLVKGPIQRVFQAVSTANGLGKFWSYNTSGPDWDNGEVVLKWPASGHHARVCLSKLNAPVFVEWSVIEHHPFEELKGTAIQFTLEEQRSGEVKLIFRQVGLVPQCDCYDACSNAWGYLVGQIKKLVEQGYA